MIHPSQDVLFSDDDRFFAAVRYLLAEMSADEAAQFEAELDESQQLRELVAEAVLVLEAAGAAGAASQNGIANRERSGHRQRSLAGWSVLAASLLIAAAVGVSLTFWSGEPPLADHDKAASSDETQLAAAWARHAAEQEDGLTAFWDEGLLTAAVAEEPLTDDESIERLLAAPPAAPPAWMLKALEAQEDNDAARSPL